MVFRCPRVLGAYEIWYPPFRNKTPPPPVDCPGGWICFVGRLARGGGFCPEMNCVSLDRSPGGVDLARQTGFHRGGIIMKCGVKTHET